MTQPQPQASSHLTPREMSLRVLRAPMRSRLFCPSQTCLNCARQPERNGLDRIHAAEIHQCTIAPQLHAASMDEEAKQE